jgi:TolB-like protein
VSLEAGMRGLSETIARQAPPGRYKKVAVTEFVDMDGVPTRLGARLASELTAALFDRQAFEIVDRQFLERLVAEHELALRGYVAEESAKKLGRMSGADAIVTGAYVDRGATIRVHARLIDVESGAIAAAANADVLPDQGSDASDTEGVFRSPGKGPKRMALSFDSLPSDQGWQYTSDYHAAPPESRVFTLKDGVLAQDSVGVGALDAQYNLPGIVDPRATFDIRVRARVLAKESRGASDDANSFGFSFGVQCEEGEIGVGLDPARITDASHAVLTTATDNRLWHDYRLVGRMDQGYRFFIDGALIATGGARREKLRNRVYLGDITGGPNARAEISRYSFEQKR